MAGPRRREEGDGGISEYRTRAGPRFLIEYAVLREDGTTRVVLERRFVSRRDAAAALRAEIRAAEVGEWVEPSKQGDVPGRGVAHGRGELLRLGR